MNGSNTIRIQGIQMTHDFRLIFQPGWGLGGEGTVKLTVGDVIIAIRSDSDAQNEKEPNLASFALPLGRNIFSNDLSDDSALEFEEFKLACDAAWELTRLINAWNADAIAEATQRELEADQKREEEEKVRNAVIAGREEIMLQELVGERVKVRHRHYKTMCYGRVITRATAWDDSGEETEWTPSVHYSDQGQTRDGGVGTYARLDAKTEKGWRTVWDDGKEDLPEYDRSVKLPKVKAWNE